MAREIQAGPRWTLAGWDDPPRGYLQATTKARPAIDAASFARASNFDQGAANELQELRRYVNAGGWQSVEYVDRGVSGAKDRRPALDHMISDAKLRRFDVLVCWRLDRLGRNLKHLITLLDDLQELGVGFVSLNEGIDATTAAGRLQMAVLAAIAAFERDRIVERVRAGLARARTQGKRLGRPRAVIPADRVQNVSGLPLHEAASALGVSRSTMKRWRQHAKHVGG